MFAILKGNLRARAVSISQMSAISGHVYNFCQKSISLSVCLSLSVSVSLPLCLSLFLSLSVSEVRSNEIRQQLKWKNLLELRAMHKLIMMHKVLNNMAPF